jgi:hypothetical protein
MLGGLNHPRRLLSDPDIHGRFETDVNDLLGDRIRESDELAAEFWSALANVDWYHADFANDACSYSFRAAGDLIAAIRQSGNYMDWYCSGPYAHVMGWIEQALASRGWTYKTN